LYGLHDPGGESLMAEQKVSGWILFTEELGSDPNQQRGGDYSRWANQDFGVLVRLNHGYEPNGTIPFSNRYAEFAKRCANFVRNSQGCHIWIIGNEMNHPVERPGVRLDWSQQPPKLLAPGELILPGLYVNCFRQCRAVIKAVPGHENDQVVVGGVAPWNPQTAYDGNPNGDWVKYLADILNILAPDGCDGIAIHTYTHGRDPKLIYTDAFMNPPFQNRQYNFRAYQDFMNAIPRTLRSLPVYITETDQDEEWRNENNGWVQRAYGEIDWWNKQPGNQKIRALILYRWPKGLDRWGIDGKQGVIEDFKQAMANRYRWDGVVQPQPEPEPQPQVPVYAAQFLTHTTPAQMNAGQVSAVTLTVRNNGTKTWVNSGSNPVRVGYHWFDGAGKPVTLPAEADLRTPLPKAVAPNEQVQISAQVVAPGTAGAYVLEWDLVEEGKTWFAGQDSTPLSLKVAVQAQVQPTPPVVDTSPVKFNETGRTAQGPFVAFYRQYGLDITGYPISDQYVHPESGLNTQDWQRLVIEEFPPGKIRLRLAGQELADLRQQVKRLEQEIARLKAGVSGPAEPEISDITAQLPRDPARFARRPLDAIQFVVINHTGVRPEVGADRVALAQRARWPGIVGQYFITGDGKIQQTNPMDEVVTADQKWIFNGINVYVAGNFDETVPGDAQLQALAELCAWLLARYNLAEDAIKGVSEFIVTRSPGLQWLGGQRWKDQLLTRVRAIPVVPVPVPGQDVAALRGQLETLQAQVRELEAQVADLQQRNADLQQRNADLEERNAELQQNNAALQQNNAALQQNNATLQQSNAALQQNNATLQQSNAALQAQVDALQAQQGTQLAPPPITDISQQLPHNPDALKARPKEQIKYLVFNHTAVDPSVGVERIAVAHQRRWGAILYQYLVTGDGTVLQTNPVDQTVDPSQLWIAQGVNIAVAGNFTAEIPNEQQMAAAAKLSAWLIQEYGIPTENVKGVSEFINTQSPGVQWLTGKKWKELLLAQIAEVQKSVPPAPTPGESAALAALRAQLSQLQAAMKQAQANLAALTQERDQLRAQLGSLPQDRQQLVQQVQTLTQQVQSLTADKTGLTQQVQILTADQTALTKQVQTLTADKTGLTQQVQTLTTDKTALAQQLSGANQTISAQQERIKVLEAGGGVSPAAPTGPRQISPPEISDIVDKLPKHATLKYDTRTLDKITHIAIHHSAAPANVTPERVAAYHVSKDWPGIGYHFYVAPDGIIYQTNRLETISYNVYMQNHYVVGICVAGTFSGVVPTPRQIEQTGHLVAWLTQKLNVKPENVWGHKQFPQNTSTECPGNDWSAGKQWRELLMARVKAVQAGQMGTVAKTIGHYMLFWQRPDNWAREDWAAAANYFARFRPTAGFSPEDARNAEYVTIVGGTAGVPYETEQALTAAGCKVERLAGIDFADTKRMLDELAQSGRRFKTFNV
jgi:N-acetyl-anhydromuramyl-L-alanine amidase AmpD/predicted  nucleic acid-binding Zn-ribbon protein